MNVENSGYFTVRMFKYWKRLPREAVISSVMETFRSQLVMSLSNQIYLDLVLVQVWIRWLLEVMYFHMLVWVENNSSCVLSSTME